MKKSRVRNGAGFFVLRFATSFFRRCESSFLRRCHLSSKSILAWKAVRPRRWRHEPQRRRRTLSWWWSRRHAFLSRKGLLLFIARGFLVFVSSSLCLFLSSSLRLFLSSSFCLFVSLTLSLLVFHPFARFVSKTVLHQRTPLRERPVKVNVGGKVVAKESRRQMPFGLAFTSYCLFPCAYPKFSLGVF